MADEVIKHDNGKLRWDLLPIESVEGAIRVLMEGVKSHSSETVKGDHNWRAGTDWTKYLNSAARHLAAMLRGEDIDPFDGLPHADHLTCNAMFLSEYLRRHKDKDDRYKPKSS